MNEFKDHKNHYYSRICNLGPANTAGIADKPVDVCPCNS